MADPCLNSVHLEAPRRQEYRRARDILLRGRGSQTIFLSHGADSSQANRTFIENNKAGTKRDLTCWLADGEYLYPLHVGVNTLGRSHDNDVVVEDAFASRRHCALLAHSAGTIELHDMASKNGTYLNGKRLSAPAQVKDGDEIRVSDQCFIFHTRSGNRDAASPPITLSS